MFMWHPQRDRRTDWEGRGERRDRSCEETGSPAVGEDASEEESAWKQLAAYPGTRVLHNLQEPVGCHLPEATREGSWRQGRSLHRLFLEVWLGLPRDSEVGATLLRRGQVSQAEELT